MCRLRGGRGGGKRLFFFCCFTIPSIFGAQPLFLLHTLYLSCTPSLFGKKKKTAWFLAAHHLFVLHTICFWCTPSFCAAHPLFMLHTFSFFNLKKKKCVTLHNRNNSILVQVWFENDKITFYPPIFFSVKITTLLWPYSLKNQ